MKQILLYCIVLFFCTVSSLEARIITANPDKLPIAARNFITAYFPDLRITIIKIDPDSKQRYEVILSNGCWIEFGKKGIWTKIHGTSAGVPASIIPENIIRYLELHQPNLKINSVKREKSGYTIGLHNREKLYFDKKGELTSPE